MAESLPCLLTQHRSSAHPSYAFPGNGWHQAWCLSNPRSCRASVTSKPEDSWSTAALPTVAASLHKGEDYYLQAVWLWARLSSLLQTLEQSLRPWAVPVSAQSDPVLSKRVATSVPMVPTPGHWGKSVFSVILELDLPRTHHHSILAQDTSGVLSRCHSLWALLQSFSITELFNWEASRHSLETRPWAAW